MSSSTESRTGIMVDLSRAGPLPSETKVRLTSETVKVTRSGDVSQKLGHSVSWVRPKPIRWPTSGTQVSQTWDSLRMGPRFLPRLRAGHGPPRGPRHRPRLPTVSRVPFVGHTRLLRAHDGARPAGPSACGPRNVGVVASTTCLRATARPLVGARTALERTFYGARSYSAA